MPDDIIKPWEQQDNESEEAFEAFAMYRDLGLDRSLAKVAAALGKSVQLIERWSSRDAWRLRVLAWDRHEARVLNETIVLGKAKMRARHIAQAQNMQSRAAQRIQKMSDNEIAAMTPGQVVQLFRAAREAERDARAISDEELAASEREDAPTFVIQFVAQSTDGMVPVRMVDGTAGYIPLESVDLFKAENQGAVVIL